MLASGSPWQARRVGHSAIADVVRKTLLTYWNTVSFQSLYARAAGWQPASGAPAPAERPVIDRWVLSQAQLLARGVDEALDGFDTQRAGRLLSSFIDDLSNWYVRRSRRRFWDGDPAALATLHEALRVVTLCLAPFTPFITERVWQDLFRPTDPEAPVSVHLASWPEPDPALVDDALAEQMGLVRRLVELGRSARASSSVRTRQPLRRALVSSPGWGALPADLRGQVAEELNVHHLESLGDESAGLVDVSVKANFRSLGARFGKQTPLAAAAVGAADAADVVRQLRDHGTVRLHAGDLGPIDVTEADVVVTETPREGWAVVTEAGESLALDLTIDDELRRAGLAREVVRTLQEGRKTAGLDVSDRIHVWWSGADAELAAAISEHADAIRAEVLARSLDEGPANAEAATVETDLPVSLWLARA